MRKRTLLSAVAALLVAATLFAPFAHRPATAATAQPLDLAVMALQPGDLSERGYGIQDGQPVTAAEMAATLADAHGGKAGDEQRYARELTSAGWQHGYFAGLGRADPSDPSRYAATVGTQIVEFSSSSGATRGFAVLEDQQGIAGVSQHTPSSRIGNRTLITVDRRFVNDATGPRVSVDVTFQAGNLVATVYVVTYGSKAKAATDSTLMDLATTLAKRIATARQGKDTPQLSTRALLLTGPAINTYYANYDRLGDVNIPYAGESGSALSSRDTTYKTNHVTDVFYAMQTSGEYGTGDYGLYSLHVQRFAHQADAVSWLERMTPASVAADGTQTKATEIKNAPRFGDQSITFRYSYLRADNAKSGGYVVILRTGRTVASVQIDGVPAVSLATVGKVASAQATCQKAGDCRAPLTSPLAAPSTTATPAATPAASSNTESTATVVFRGNAAHTGEQPGPGPTGDLSLTWHWAPADAPMDYNDGSMTPPTLVDGTIYVGTGVAGGDYGGRIAAIDARTGKQRWIFKTAMFVTTPVTVSSGMAYALDQTGTLYALDATTGKQVWSAPTGALTTTPAVADGLVYVGTVSNGYGVAALDARSGKRRWSFTATELVESAPTVVDGVVYVGGSAYVSGTSYPGVLYALDARTGKERWRAETPQTARGAGDLATTPAVANGLVYATSKGGTLYAIDTATGKTVWTADDCATPPAVANGAVYCGGSILHAFNAKTGKELWRGSATSPNADPVVAGDRLYLAAIGHLNVIDAATGKLVTTVNAPIALNYEVSPLVVDGVVYVNGRNMNGTGWLLAIGGS